MPDQEPVAVDDALADAGNGTKLAYLVLKEADRPLSSDEIAERTQLAERSMWHVLENLADAGLVEKRPHPEDRMGGRLVYRVRD